MTERLKAVLAAQGVGPKTQFNTTVSNRARIRSTGTQVEASRVGDFIQSTARSNVANATKGIEVDRFTGRLVASKR